MVNISYTEKTNGDLVATWPGKSVRNGKKVRKVGQIYLGKVIDKERYIFWTEKRGYYTFNPDTQIFGDPQVDFIPPISVQPDRRKISTKEIIDFGDSYFLDNLIKNIGYNDIIDAIQYANRDTLYAMIAYYVLEQRANTYAEGWWRQNFVSFIYPKANISSQRISDMLKYIGKPEQIRRFLIAHIKYILESTSESVYIVIDSTGVENKCNIPFTCISSHGSTTKLEFRIIAVIQKSTGLPLYFEIIAGNIVDITTLERTIETLSEYNCKVQYCLGDAGYCCPSVIERLVFSGIEFMTRLSPTYKIYKETINNNINNLDKDENIIRFRNRLISIVKTKSVIAIDKCTKEKKYGYIYLCKDLQSNSAKSLALYDRSIKNMTTEQLLKAKRKFGVFALITTMDIAKEDILHEYYIRQSIEQYFDMSKQYTKFLPVRQHNLETLRGHLLLSFIATFIMSLIKNRMNILDVNYVKLSKMIKNNVYGKNNGVKFIDETEAVIEQERLNSISRESPSTLFYELRWQKADVYAKTIIPSVSNKRANDFYNAFGLSSPFKIAIKEDKLVYTFKNKPKGLTKELCFSSIPTISDEEILKKIEYRKNKCNNSAKSMSKNSRGRGRVLGSKNKKTILRIKLLEILRNLYESKGGKINDLESIKSKKCLRGRKLGSLNKKTIARNRLISILKFIYKSKGGDLNKLANKEKKGHGGRPRGRKNRKTLKRIELINVLKSCLSKVH